MQLEDLKQYFERSDSDDDDTTSPRTLSDGQSIELFTLSEETVITKADLLDLLPSWQILDRLVVRYFAWHPPSSRKLLICANTAHS